MRTRNALSILIVTGVSMLPVFGAYGQSPADVDLMPLSTPHFTFVSNTGGQYNLVVTAADIDGVALVPGDEVGVFDGDLCVGAVVWPSTLPASLIAWEDDPDTPEVDGYVCTNPMSFRIWDNSAGFYVNAQAAYTTGDGLFCTGSTAWLTLSGVGENVQVTGPNSGEALSVGQSYPITWTSQSIDNVRIWYGTPDAKAWTLIVDSTPAAAGFYMWTVPNTPGQWHIRICDASDEDPCDQTDQVFAIFQLIDITSPDGGEQWMVGTHHDITWVHAGVESIGIVYGEAGNWTQIVPIIPAPGGSYDWEIPNDPGTWSVGIYDAADGNPFSISSTFDIYVPSVTVTSPNGGETWLVGSEQLITWDSQVDPTVITSVSIEYASDAEKQTWQEIAASTENDGEYLWTVPNDNSTDCAVRICALDSPLEACDTSDGSFEIYQTVTVTAPNGGETWGVGTLQDIEWTSEGIDLVRIEYGFEDDKGWTVIEESIAASATPYSWEVPDTPGDFRVRVCDVEDTNPCDTSNGTFTIEETIEVTVPAIAEEWVVGSTHDIEWTSGGIDSVHLMYGFQDPRGWTTIEVSLPASATPYSWLVPDDPGVYYIRACDAEDQTPCDNSDVRITIVETLELTAPTGGEEWMVGTDHDITWTSGGIQNVDIYYGAYDGKAAAVVENLIVEDLDASLGTYAWTIPNDPGFWQVRILDSQDGVPLDTSDYLELYSPSVTVLSPNGGERWLVGSGQSITWDSRVDPSVITNVSIEYASDADKQTWQEIVASTPNDGTHPWTVPNDNSMDCIVRICALDSPVEACDTSDDLFEIYQTVDVTSPAGGETWVVGTMEDIEWTSEGIDLVSIEYGFDDGKGWTVIEASIAASATPYSWEVPDHTGNFYIRVCDAEDQDPCDSSRGMISIEETLTLTAPTGGEEWMVGSDHDITWTSDGIANVDIYYGAYDIKAGAPVPVPVEEYLIVEDFDASLGTHPWTIPNNPGFWQVRILDSEDGVPLDTGGFFEIFAPTVTVLDPNGGEVWIVGSVQDIDWSWRGDFTDVSIEYTTAGTGRAVWVEVIASTPNDGTYEWTIPDTPSQDCYVKVCGLGTAVEACDESDEPFEIQAQEYVEVVAPNGGEEWAVGSQQLITWNTVEVEMLRIQYGDESRGWTVVTDMVASEAGSYLWTIPNDPGDWLVRICDWDGEPCDVSDDTFEIYVPYFEVTRPNGGEIFIVGTDEMITWESRGDFDWVSIEYSYSEGGEKFPIWNEVDYWTENDGEFLWTVPDTPSEICLVRVGEGLVKGATKDGWINDVSDEYFEIQEPESLAVVLPAGGEEFTVGSVEEITWTAVEVESIGIVYGIPAAKVWYTIEASWPAAGGSYMWTIPNDPGFWQVGIYDVEDGAPAAFSNEFEIYGEFIMVTQPNGGEDWTVGDAKTITWTSRGEFTDVMIEYTTNASTKSDWTLITLMTPDDGVYEWTIPDTPSADCKVRVCESMRGRGVEPQICDESDDVFTIRSAEYLEVVLPAGGEHWLVGTQQTIDWVAVEVENIGIVYGQSGNWKTIETSVPAGKGSYLWTIPDDPGIWRIGIYDASDGNPVGFSNDFEIYDTYTVSGCVDYMHNGIPVPGAGVWLGRPEKTETMTGPDGCYEFTEVEGNEDYILSPWKDNDVPLFTVMGWDAALCNRVALGMEIPPPGGSRSASHAESLSCDLNRDGVITEGDAAAIANKAAGLDWWKSEPIPEEWIFEPSYREIIDLTSDMTEENFSAVLLGDVDGNWVTGLRGAKGAEPASYEATATVVNNQLEVYIRLRPTFGVVSMDCAFSYDPTILQVSSAVVDYAFMYYNPVVGVHNADGLVYLCAYRPDPSRVQGRVVTVVFDILNSRGDVPPWALELEGFFVNDQPAVGDPLDYTSIPTPPAGFVGAGIQPNPFNPETSIGFYLPQGEPRPVSLMIYNLQGQLVRTLVDDVLDAGEHTLTWNGRNEFGVEVATGVFFAVLETGDLRQTRKLMLLK